MNLPKLAKEVILTNTYCTLATATKKGKPWASPVFYAVDKRLTIYYISQMRSKHTQNILKNSRVSFAIFDSHQKEGSGNGVQGYGKAYLLAQDELDEAFQWYYTSFVPMKKESFMGKAPYRFFKIIPEHFYILDPKADVDRRVEVLIFSKRRRKKR